MRHRESRDANEREIVRTLEAIPGVRVRRIPNEVGTADLLVRRATWAPGMWLVCELKTATGAVKPHQQAMLDRGETILARNVGDILTLIGVNT